MRWTETQTKAGGTGTAGCEWSVAGGSTWSPLVHTLSPPLPCAVLCCAVVCSQQPWTPLEDEHLQRLVQQHSQRQVSAWAGGQVGVQVGVLWANWSVGSRKAGGGVGKQLSMYVGEQVRWAADGRASGSAGCSG